MEKIFLFAMLAILSGFVFVSGAFAAAPHAHGEHSAPVMGELAALEGKDFERAFYSMMIPHHEGAVAMSRLILGKSKDPKVMQWAKSIVLSQTREIEWMRMAMEKLGGVEDRFYNPMRDDMSRMLQGVISDRDFVRVMIPHHESAIEMAKLVPGRTKDPQLLKLAHDIVDGQSKEVAEFNDWLKK